MKKTIFKNVIAVIIIANVILYSANCFAQGAAINTTGTAADASAGLDIQFNNKGLLIPRMTTGERNAIVNPAEGLQIYNIDTKCLEYYVNGTWNKIACPCPSIDAPTEGTHTSLQTEIVWNWNAVNGASGYQWNTSNTYPGTGVNVLTNTTYTQIGLICNTSYTLYLWAYNDCGNSSSITLSKTTSNCWNCGSTLSITHTAGAVAPITKIVNYGTISSTQGGTGDKCWITQNLGSSNQATSATDATENSSGWYWQFNRKQGFKHDGTTRTPNTTWDVTSDNTYNGWDPAKDPCTLLLGTSWRLPTYTEWNNVHTIGGWTSITNGYNSVFKLHAAGYLHDGTGNCEIRGNNGYYYSSSQSNPTVGWHYRLGYGMLDYVKTYGMSIRCLRD